MNRTPLLDNNGEVRELTAEDFALASPITEVMSPEFMAMIAQHETQRKTRGKQKQPTKQSITLRLSPQVIVAFKSQGKGWQTRINDVLLNHIQQSR